MGATRVALRSRLDVPVQLNGFNRIANLAKDKTAVSSRHPTLFRFPAVQRTLVVPIFQLAMGRPGTA